MQPRAQVHFEHFQCDYAELQEGKKMQVTLKVHILDGDTAVAEFTGVYWVLPRG
jgi:hypothetical protein